MQKFVPFFVFSEKNWANFYINYNSTLLNTMLKKLSKIITINENTRALIRSNYSDQSRFASLNRSRPSLTISCPIQSFNGCRRTRALAGNKAQSNAHAAIIIVRKYVRGFDEVKPSPSFLVHVLSAKSRADRRN